MRERERGVRGGGVRFKGEKESVCVCVCEGERVCVCVCVCVTCVYALSCAGHSSRDALLAPTAFHGKFDEGHSRAKVHGHGVRVS